MSLAYFDSSALVKLLIQEDGSEDAFNLWLDAHAVSSSQLSHPEVFSALAAARRAARLTRQGLASALQSWEVFWRRCRIVELTEDIARRAGDLTQRHDLGGADAVHLASALSLYDDSLAFASWDQRLLVAARDAGLHTLPV